MSILKLAKVEQEFSSVNIEDIKREVRLELERSNPSIPKGGRIGLACGSRGIRNIALIVKTVGEYIRKRGAHPFIIPAMGSHGSATAQGQIEVLESLGITKDYTGMEIHSTMETVELKNPDSNIRVFMDKFAAESDGVIVINRIKPHTDFHSDIESGLMKMCVIGLGKHRQATYVHGFSIRGLMEMIVPAARVVLKSSKILAGLGIVENAYDETMIIKSVLPEDMEREEEKLLLTAKANMPKILIDQADILIIDEMGKDISGVGMDTNIIGRMGIEGQKDPLRPSFKRIVVCDLTCASHGNALGMGLADVITEKLSNKIDFKATYENVVTSSFLERGKMPVTAPDPRSAFMIALRSLGVESHEDLKIVRIKNTLDLKHVYLNKKCFNEIDNIRLISDFSPAFEGTELSKF